MKRSTQDPPKNPLTATEKPYKLTKTRKIKKQHPLKGLQEKDYPVNQKAAIQKRVPRKHNNSATADQFLQEVGKRLYQLRNQKQVSQKGFGRLVGIDGSKLAKMEKGKVNFTLLTFHEICTANKITPKEFWDF